MADRVRDREMPPSDAEQPSESEVTEFVAALDQWLFEQDLQRQTIDGRAHARRLNRDELQSVLISLFATRTDYRSRMPEDQVLACFDKAGAALSTSHEHVLAMMDIADSVLREVFDDKAKAFQSDRPMRTRLRVSARGDQAPIRYREYVSFPPEGDTIEVTTYVGTGEMLRVSPIETAGSDFLHRVPFTEKRSASTYPGPGLLIEWAEIEGPLVDPSHEVIARWLHPIGSQSNPLHARETLSRFLPLAFRRPVSEEELDHYMSIYSDVKTKEHFSDLKLALKAALCAPYFFYVDAPAGPLADFDLAERLSLFFWNSIPDDELIIVCAKGELRDPRTLLAQVDRMLNDPKSNAFRSGFVSQWLELRKINATTPDERLYPEWDELLEWSALRQSQQFFDTMLDENLTIRTLVKSAFTFLNDRLAEHYGIDDIQGVDLRRVELAEDSVRGGVMSQAAVLKVTADGTVTSPVRRGAWFMERIMGSPVPPPPQNVPAIEPDIRGATTIREQLDQHRSDPACAACHAKMDPAGFAMECFDAIGGYRQFYRAEASAVQKTVEVKKPITFDFEAIWKDAEERHPMFATVGVGKPVDASGVLQGNCTSLPHWPNHCLSVATVKSSIEGLQKTGFACDGA